MKSDNASGLDSFVRSASTSRQGQLLLAVLVCVTSLLSHQSARAGTDELKVCSFNVQFLGSSDRRRNSTLAKLLKDCDIAVIQELVAPPFPGTFPNGDPFKPDSEAAAFFGAMMSLGFDYVLSEEDTGTREKIHSNGSGTEWSVAFYKKDQVHPAEDLPHGFLASQRGDHPDFERVPYAFSFRTADKNLDFVLISVHLKPSADPASAARRKHELASIAGWIETQDAKEHDFIILGDMNIEDAEELGEATPDGFLSLNDECRQTNTNQREGAGRPYDHVMYRPAHNAEIDTDFDLRVIDLIQAVRSRWNAKDGPFPGEPYDHNRFRAYYSDHHPVRFRFKIPDQDDD
ncbi:MAG: endonuclease/exonuclease/phosphatase family protein [Planctomycetota bacterium]|nr:endonuclease/exonuclease/phosphatase family protein [Planctomycetota bacterium]